LTYTDYPSWAVSKGVSAASVVHVVVDPQGKSVECTALREIGNPQLAKEICPLIRRKDYQPPTLRDGQRVYAVLDTMIRLYLPDTKQGQQIMGLRQSPDAEIVVNKLPNNTASDVSIILAYDSAGRVTDCVPSEHESEIPLANVACGQRALFDNVIQKDLAGQPVAYVTRKRVRFNVSPQSK
jgi:hypothetical protein